MYHYSRAPASSSPSRRSSGHVGIPALAPPRPRGHAAARTTTSAPAPAMTNDAAAAEGASFVFSSLPSPASLVCVSKEEADTASPSRRTSVFSRVGTRVGRADGVVKPVRADPGALGLGSGVGFGVGAGRGASWSLGRRRTASDQSRSAWSTPAAAGAAASAATTPSHASTSPARMAGVTSSGGTGASALATREAQSSVCRASLAAETGRAKSSRHRAVSHAEEGVPRRVFRRRDRGRGTGPRATSRLEPFGAIADARRGEGACEALGARSCVPRRGAKARARKKSVDLEKRRLPR